MFLLQRAPVETKISHSTFLNMDVTLGDNIDWLTILWSSSNPTHSKVSYNYMCDIQPTSCIIKWWISYIPHGMHWLIGFFLPRVAYIIWESDIQWGELIVALFFSMWNLSFGKYLNLFVSGSIAPIFRHCSPIFSWWPLLIFELVWVTTFYYIIQV